MKRILSIIISLVLVIGSLPAIASDYTDFLKNIGVVPSGFGSHNAEENVTRGEFSYMVGGILAGVEIAPKDTRFSDVTAKDEYSGHVEFLASLGVINGYGDGTFGKDDSVSLETAYVILMRALGYDGFMKQSGNISGYTELASIVGLDVNSHTNKEGYVTKSGAAEIIYDALTSTLAEVTYINGANGNLLSGLTDSDRGILAESFGISAYKGLVSDVDVSEHSIEFTVSKNLYKNNPVMLNAGTKAEYQANGNLNIYEYNQTSATIWVNQDNELVHIAMDKGVSVRYANIFSVNGDDSSKSIYGTNSINRMTFLDDEEEYDVSEDATYKYNGKAFSGQISLCGKYARVVMKNNEITHIESWDLEEGGLITEVGTTDIRYIKGAQNCIIKSLNNYDTVMYFIAGRHASAGELKTDSVFYFYKNDDYIVFVVSEKTITDIFNSKSDGRIEIGNSVLLCSNTMYYKSDSDLYSKVTDTSAVTDLFGKTIKAYLGPDEKVLYIKPDSGETIKSEFYAAVSGIVLDSLSEDEGEIELLILEDGFSTERYKITKKTNLNGIKLDELNASKRDLSGKGVYSFKVNEAGAIVSVQKPEDFYGYGVSPVSYTSTSFGTLAGTAVVKIDGAPLYFTGEPIIALYSEDGKFSATELAWSELTSRSFPSKATLTFYGRGKTSTPSLVLLTGAVNEIGGTKTFGGVVMDKLLEINEAGDSMVNLVVATPLGKKEYRVTPELAETLKIHTFIRYIEDTKMSENEINIRKTWDISKTHDTWVDNSTNMQMHKGTVEMADDKRIYFSDGTAIFMHPSNFQIMCVDESNPNKRFDAYSVDQIMNGDTIFYTKDSEGIKFILAVK